MKSQPHLLLYLYHAANGKYLKFKSRVDKAVHSGKFQQLSQRKRFSLIQRLRKLRDRIRKLYFQLKLAGAGVAASLAFSLMNPANAQTTLGPYEEIVRSENPLRPPFLFSQPARPASIDWDNDGDYDLVVGAGGSLKYLENTGTREKPAFDERTGEDNPFNFTIVGTEAAPVFVDFDKDSDLDLFIGTAYNDFGAILYYKNVGGSFEKQDPHQPWDNSAKTGNPFHSLTSDVLGGSHYLEEHAKLLFNDWDKDGDMDVFIGQDLEAGHFYYYRNDLNAPSADDRKFTPLSPNSIGLNFTSGSLPGGYGQAAQFSDFDDDGDNDFILGSDEGGIIFLANDGQGEFHQQEGPWNATTKTGNPFHELAYGTTTPHVVDLDDDGRRDVILHIHTGAFEGSPLAYLKSEGNGVFKRVDSYDEERSFDNPLDGFRAGGDYTDSYKGAMPEFIDVDNDGDLDVLIGDKYSSDVLYFENINGAFSPAESPLGETSFSDETNVVAADINGDGFKDIFICQRPQEENDGIPAVPAVRLFINNQDGTFTEGSDPFMITEIASPFNLAFIDIDGDNDLDAWMTADFDPQFYRNEGSAENPSFTYDENNPLPDFSFNYKTRFETIDVDGDNDLDVFATDYGFARNLFINQGVEDGTSTFIHETAENNPFDFFNSNQQFPGFTDHDQDGDTDIFINALGGSFNYIKNENPAPDLTSSGPFQFNLPVNKVIVCNNFGLDDPDDDSYREAVVSILGYEQGHDILEYDGNLSEPFKDVYFDELKGQLHFVANTGADADDFERILESVTYQYSEEGSGNRKKDNSSARTTNTTIRFQVFDADRTTPVPVDIVFLANAVNQVPVVTSNGNPPLFATGTTLIAPLLTVTDPDNSTLQSASIVITGGLNAAEDELLFTDQNGITGTYTASTGTLSLTGTSLISNYQDAIRSIQYQNKATLPSETPRIFSITVNDGQANSLAANVTLTINRAPAISNEVPVTAPGEVLVINLSGLSSDPDNNLDLTQIDYITIIQQPASGAVARVISNAIEVDYSGVRDFVGNDQMTIEICDLLDRCTEQVLTIKVTADIEVFNFVSLNGDDLNQYLYLRYIKASNQVTIYNRWGDKVFDVRDYDNADPLKRFQGFNNNGDELPSGTYFYKVEYDNAVAKSGYLSLIR
jgi:gliding motility-associated-like protein